MDTEPVELIVTGQGHVRCIYDERVDLERLGPVTITRASHIEPDERGGWWADMAPVGGPKLGPFRLRSRALQAETQWLRQHLAGHVVG